MDVAISELNKTANTIRQDIIEIAYKAGGPSHPGPALSCADILTALYFSIMKIAPENPTWELRDRFILSKGHACPVLYATLARKGYFPYEWLYSLRRLDSHLQGHPDMKKTPGIDMTSGSLGCGLSAGLGMAYYLKLAKTQSKVFVVLGDGELQEGAVWEAAMSASALKLNNLIAIIDSNRLQSCGAVEDIISQNRIKEVWRGFGWNVLEIDGHNMEDILQALKESCDSKDTPTCIIAHTIKGKGVSFMENNNDWHQKIPTKEEYEQAKNELNAERATLL